MSDDAMLQAAKAEVQRLEAEIAKSPLGQKLALARQVVALYGEAPGAGGGGVALADLFDAGRALMKTVQTVQHHVTKTAQVENACADYLRSINRRASSGELLEVVKRAGIPIPGVTPAKSLSAYLSNSPMFDNVRDEGGYGLVEWSQKRSETETAAEPKAAAVS